MRWLARVFARAIVRRIAYVIVAALLAQLAVSTKAHAFADCTSDGTICDQGIARTMCEAAVARTVEYWKSLGNPSPYVEKNCTGGEPQPGGWGVYTCAVRASTNGPIACRNAGGDINVQTFYYNETCSQRNAAKLADAALAYSAPPTCIAGCRVQGEPFTSATGGVKLYGMRNRSYNGDTCEAQIINANDINQNDEKQKAEDETKPKGPECTALGNGQTGCQKPDGDYCATASTGKTFCWKPSEKGKKTDAQDGQTRDEKGKPVTPPDTPPAPDKDWQRKEGHQQEACINNTCVTYNVTNYGSTDKGTAKNGSGDNNVDGTGNTSGNGAPGKGSGGGDKEGEGDSATDSGNCEAAPMCTGDTLKCLHLRYTWKNQCNTTKDEVVGGDDCKSVPVCIGKGCKAQEYASVLQQWRGRCAAEGDRAKLAADAAAGAADAAGDDQSAAVSDLWKKGPGQDGQGLDRNKLTLGGGELFPAIDIMGTSWAPPAQLYSVLQMIRQLVIAAGALAAMYILFRK
jgi:hypothetical protein